jgi:hypothetical protein
MERSIESIWKQGFLQKDALVVPQLNNLYGRKSIHFIEKLKRMLHYNHYFIAGLGIVSMAAGYFMGGVYLGLFMGLIFIPILLSSHNNLKKMDRVDYNSSCYQYLLSFDRWLKSAIANFTKVFRFFYALFFAGWFIGLWLSKSEAILRKFPDAWLVAGVPWFIILAAIIIVGLMIIFGESMYKLDLKLMYGGMFTKLENMITEMEELRKQDYPGEEG